MKKVMLLSVVFFFALSSMAIGEEKEESIVVESFEILVVDAETEEPLPAALIKISEINKEAYTDFDGFAKFSSLKIGFYDVDVSFISYSNVHLEDLLIDKTNRQVIIKLKQ